MDRRIKAILLANGIDDLASVQIVDYNDDVLEIVKNDKTQYISLEGRVHIEDIEEQFEEIKEDIFETKTSDEKMKIIIEEIENGPITVTVKTSIEEVDDDLFNIEEKIDDDIDDFHIDLDDDFNFDDEVKEVEKIKKPIKKSKFKKKSKKKDDDFINLL